MITPLQKRRALLRFLAATPALASLGWPFSVQAATASLQPHALTDQLSLITGAGGNVVLFKGREGLTLIDSGESDKAQALLALVDELGEQAPLRTLVNTHWHADHSGGNDAVRALGASIVAHENTRLWLGADFEVHWRQQHFTPRAPAALPDTTFYLSGELDLGGEVLQCHYSAQAHTDGDLFLHFPDSNVMVAGGLMTQRRYPICDIATGGWIGGLINANKAMLALANNATVIVPDRGLPLTKADLQQQHDMLSVLFEKMKELTREGFNGDDLLRIRLTADYDAVWGDPEEFVQETYRGMWAHTYDMGGYI
jgi:glyoxylase-like metal-dependent hydrolase (beta-lactamase superfamily II)